MGRLWIPPTLRIIDMDRFSQLYLERGQPGPDGVRFRNRLAAYFDDHLNRFHGLDVIAKYEKVTGAVVDWNGAARYFSSVFRKAELRDVLDAITIVFDVLSGKGFGPLANDWMLWVGRVLREENVGYRVDERCVVHYHVDQEFERNRGATVAILELPRFSGVRASFEDAYRHLDNEPRDTKAAVRSMFESLETLVRLIVPEAKNLSRFIVENHLKPKCLAAAGGDKIEQEVLSRLIDGLGDWVDALHFYRHGQPTGDPVAPSEELAVHVLSTGSSYLRQMASFALRTG